MRLRAWIVVLTVVAAITGGVAAWASTGAGHGPRPVPAHAAAAARARAPDTPSRPRPSASPMIEVVGAPAG